MCVPPSGEASKALVNGEEIPVPQLVVVVMEKSDEVVVGSHWSVRDTFTIFFPSCFNSK